MIFFDPYQSIWENLDKSIKTVSALCIILAIVLIGGYLTAKTPEKKNEMARLIGIGSIVIAITVFSSLLLYPVVQKNLNTSPVPTGQAQESPESRQANAYRQYDSPTSKDDCWLCGNGSKGLFSLYWGENNVAVIDLNTFEILPLAINRYDDNKDLITQKAGFMQMNSHSFQTGESLFFSIDTDRGYADGTIGLNDKSKLSLDDLSSHLCSDCLTTLMDKYMDGGKHWNLALLDFRNKSITPLEESKTGFGVGDFLVRCNYHEDTKKIDLLVWDAPVRYQ